MAGSTQTKFAFASIAVAACLIAIPMAASAQSGIASIYSGGLTANGEHASAAGMTAAHRTLPFGAFTNRRSLLSVENLTAAIVHVLGPQHNEIVPSTTWDSLLPRSHAHADKLWYEIEKYVGGPLRRDHGAAAIVGHTALQISDRGTPGPQEVARLRTREEIATAVRRLIHEKLEVKEFTDDTPFAAMGLD